MALDIAESKFREITEINEQLAPDDAIDAREVAAAHNQLLAICVSNCGRVCQIQPVLESASMGLVYEPSPAVTLLAQSVVEIIATHAMENDGLLGVMGPREHYSKAMVESHIEFHEANLPAGVKWTRPAITDAAYQYITEVSKGNFRVLTSLMLALVRQSYERQQGAEVELTDSTPVVLRDPLQITKADIQALYESPGVQKWLQFAYEPKTDQVIFGGTFTERADES